MCKDKTAYIIGASSGIGRALAQLLAARGMHLLLVSRHLRDVETIASHCRIVYGIEAHPIALDIGDIHFNPLEFREKALQMLPVPGMVFFTAGVTHHDDNGGLSPQDFDYLTRVNYVAPVVIAKTLAPLMKTQGGGHMVFCSSVAAHFNRGKHAAYSTTKHALERYLQLIQRTSVFRHIHIQIHILGYVDTPLSQGRVRWIPVASPEDTARHIWKKTSKPGFYRGYYPAFWKWLVRAGNLLPSSLLERVTG